MRSETAFYMKVSSLSPKLVEQVTIYQLTEDCRLITRVSDHAFFFFFCILYFIYLSHRHIHTHTKKREQLIAIVARRLRYVVG